MSTYRWLFVNGTATTESYAYGHPLSLPDALPICPQGVLEWALPALFVFVVGGISTAVLSEAGKDIYKGLKALVLESYDEASKSPYEWKSSRKEPTLDGLDAQQAAPAAQPPSQQGLFRSEEHTSELQSLMRISYAVFCLKKKTH